MRLQVVKNIVFSFVGCHRIHSCGNPCFKDFHHQLQTRTSPRILGNLPNLVSSFLLSILTRESFRNIVYCRRFEYSIIMDNTRKIHQREVLTILYLDRCNTRVNDIPFKSLSQYLRKIFVFLSDIRVKVVSSITSSLRSTALPFASRPTAAPPHSWSTQTLHTGEIHFQNWRMTWKTRTVWMSLCLIPTENCQHGKIDGPRHPQVRQRKFPTPSTNNVFAIIIIIPVRRQSVLMTT